MHACRLSRMYHTWSWACVLKCKHTYVHDALGWGRCGTPTVKIDSILSESPLRCFTMLHIWVSQRVPKRNRSDFKTSGVGKFCNTIPLISEEVRRSRSCKGPSPGDDGYSKVGPGPASCIVTPAYRNPLWRKYTHFLSRSSTNIEIYYGIILNSWEGAVQRFTVEILYTVKELYSNHEQDQYKDLQ